LIACECPSAKSQREFILRLIEEGKTVDELRLLDFL